MSNLTPQLSGNEFIARAFEKLTEEEEMFKFMIEFFKNFVVTKSRPSNLNFKMTIDSVNKDLLYPLSKINRDETNKLILQKSKNWLSAHKRFESYLVSNLHKIIS